MLEEQFAVTEYFAKLNFPILPRRNKNGLSLQKLSDTQHWYVIHVYIQLRFQIQNTKYQMFAIRKSLVQSD